MHNARRIANLKSHTTRNSSGEGFELEVVRMANRKVEGDDIDVEVRACLEQGFFGCWSHGEEVVGCREGGQAVVLGGVVQDDVCTAEKAYVFNSWEGISRDGACLCWR